MAALLTWFAFQTVQNRDGVMGLQRDGAETARTILRIERRLDLLEEKRR